jgi:hypothetical protein
MPRYAKYKKDSGQIVSITICPEKMKDAQYLERDEAIIECDVNICDSTHIVKDGKFVTKEQSQVDLEYWHANKNVLPVSINRFSTTDEIDAAIAAHTRGLESVSDFKIRMYSELRAIMYPPMTDFADAYVKVQNQIPGGDEEMNAYVSRCIAVKTEYQKP